MARYWLKEGLFGQGAKGRTAFDLLVDHRAIVRVESFDVVARAAHRTAEQEPLALVLDDDVRLLPLRFAGLVSTLEHVASPTSIRLLIRPCSADRNCGRAIKSTGRCPLNPDGYAGNG